MTLRLSTLLLSTLLAFGPAAAQMAPATPSVQGVLAAVTPAASGWSVTADVTLRYTADPLHNTLLLQNVHLGPGATFPAGVTSAQTPDGLLLTLPAGSTYALTPDGHQLIVTPPTVPPVTPVPADARSPVFYPLSNADPAVVAGMVSQLYPNVRVQVDLRQRALLVLSAPEDRALIEGLIRQLDQARPQVMFEAEILEINQDATQALGIQYDSIFTLKLTEDTVPSLFKLGPIGRSPLALTMQINALKTSGAARVLAQPRVATLDGLEARINSTQTTPVIVPGASGTQSVQNITTGITLRMTPKVAPDGTVEAILNIAVSTPTGTTSQGIPQFSTREASTTVRVGNGEPIAIGGLLENRKVEGSQKVPGLGDIPLLGVFFTTTRTEEHHTDLVIIVTPRLVVSATGK